MLKVALGVTFAFSPYRGRLRQRQREGLGEETIELARRAHGNGTRVCGAGAGAGHQSGPGAKHEAVRVQRRYIRVRNRGNAGVAGLEAALASDLGVAHVDAGSDPVPSRGARG